MARTADSTAAVVTRWAPPCPARGPPPKTARLRSGIARASSMHAMPQTPATWIPTSARRVPGELKIPIITACGTRAYVKGLSSAPVANASPSWPTTATRKFQKRLSGRNPERQKRIASETK
jgi:hypothetical protein